MKFDPGLVEVPVSGGDGAGPSVTAAAE